MLDELNGPQLLELCRQKAVLSYGTVLEKDLLCEHLDDDFNAFRGYGAKIHLNTDSDMNSRFGRQIWEGMVKHKDFKKKIESQ